MASSSTNAAATTTASLEHICALEDIFHRQLLPFLTFQDVGRLERVSTSIRQEVTDNQGWKPLVQRDYYEMEEMVGPTYSTTRQSFDRLEPTDSWKQAYQKWRHWSHWTHGQSKATHLVQAIDLWARFQAVMEAQGLQNVIDSLRPGLTREEFGVLLGNTATDPQQRLPSSLLALYSVHGGQAPLRPRSQDHEFFAGLFGSFACYNNFYSLRLLPMSTNEEGVTAMKIPSAGDGGGSGAISMIGMSMGNPRMFLYLVPTEADPEGQLTMIHNRAPLQPQVIRSETSIVGRGGILNYLRQYVEQLEAGVYKRVQVIDESPSSQGIGLFPDAGPTMSCCVTRGIEVRASARWFPNGAQDQQGIGINFGYSIRMQLLETDTTDFETCQLVSRHWEFMDGNGNVRRVDGEAVIGKQPMFFRDKRSNKPGFVDLGPAGDGNRYNDKVFVYQSQSGPVAGTTPQDTKLASVKGTFSFVPGSIENPTGDAFRVTVAPFPFTVPSPFY